MNRLAPFFFCLDFITRLHFKISVLWGKQYRTCVFSCRVTKLILNSHSNLQFCSPFGYVIAALQKEGIVNLSDKRVHIVLDTLNLKLSIHYIYSRVRSIPFLNVNYWKTYFKNNPYSLYFIVLSLFISQFYHIKQTSIILTFDYRNEKRAVGI